MSNSLTLSSLLSPWGDFSSLELDAIAVEQLELDSVTSRKVIFLLP